MAVFMARHGERVDYEWARAGKNWAEQAERPWDSPLTEGGVRQAQALGRAIERHRIALKLPKFAAVYSSPLFRCVQTAAAAAASLGIDKIRIEPGLAEGMEEEWYRSWGVEGADTTWGGPKHAPMGSAVDESKLHPLCLKPASSTHGTPEELQQWLEETNPELAAKVSVDLDTVVKSTFEYTWGNFETDEDLGPRIRTVFERLVDRSADPQPILLCSHGGPTLHAYSELTGGKVLSEKVGYTGLFAYIAPPGYTAGGVWSDPIVASSEHLSEVPDATKSGPNDDAEQSAPSGK